jgi:hypothetical protein
MRILQQYFALCMAWASPALSAEHGVCLLQKRAFRGREAPATSVTLNATRNRTGRSESDGPPGQEDGEQRDAVQYRLHNRVNPNTEESAATLDSTLNGKESMSDYSSTQRETHEVNREEVLPDGMIQHSLSEKNFHDTTDGRTVHHHERHEIYREVRYPTEGGGDERSAADERFASVSWGFPEDEDGDTEKSVDADGESGVDMYYAEGGLEYQTYYSYTPPSADQLLEKEVAAKDVTDARDCYYLSAEAATTQPFEAEIATFMPDQILAADEADTAQPGLSDFATSEPGTTQPSYHMGLILGTYYSSYSASDGITPEPTAPGGTTQPSYHMGLILPTYYSSPGDGITPEPSAPGGTTQPSYHMGLILPTYYSSYSGSLVTATSEPSDSSYYSSFSYSAEDTFSARNYTTTYGLATPAESILAAPVHGPL